MHHVHRNDEEKWSFQKDCKVPTVFSFCLFCFAFNSSWISIENQETSLNNFKVKGTLVPPLHTLLILEKTEVSTCNWERAY